MQTDSFVSKQSTKRNSNVNINSSYLGRKGYVIFKSSLSTEELIRLKKELTVKPKNSGVVVVVPPITYPVYIESEKKLYIPRFFGLKEYGVFSSVKLPEGDSINIPFQGELRPIQKDVVHTYMTHVRNEEERTSGGGGGGLLELYCGFGKTILSLNIISLLKKKTLIIVHKEFLLNQWVERIHQFLPTAKIGKIQGKLIDIEGKDIVIGMLQSLSMKSYEDSVFSSFGLMVVDEVHHISSEVFSKALFKIVTKYTLGLSATMDRKDGCSFVFNYFLGDILFKSIQKEQEQVVEVRKLTFVSEDLDFNEVITDYKGNPQYSSMIVKLCSFNRRTEFILKIIFDMFLENPQQQMIVLAHNLSVLAYMYDAIRHRTDKNLTVGKYVGGMKEKALKESEDKNIILGTYSMAAEGLDIPTLTTLILVTPKTDIIQAVGRILRVKDNRPVIVDIVDTHGVFQNQYRKRQTFYRKNKYRIVETDSNRYTESSSPSTMSPWRVLFNPIRGANAIDVELECDNDEDGDGVDEDSSGGKGKKGGKYGGGGGSSGGFKPVGKCLIKLPSKSVTVTASVTASTCVTGSSTS